VPVFYHVDSERQLVIYATRGQCTGMELFVAEQEARKDPNRRPGMRILMDLQGAEEFDFSLEDLNRGVEMNSQLESSGWELEKTAVLIRSTHDEISAGLYDDLACNSGWQPSRPSSLRSRGSGSRGSVTRSSASSRGCAGSPGPAANSPGAGQQRRVFTRAREIEGENAARERREYPLLEVPLQARSLQLRVPLLQSLRPRRDGEVVVLARLLRRHQIEHVHRVLVGKHAAVVILGKQRMEAR